MAASDCYSRRRGFFFFLIVVEIWSVVICDGTSASNNININNEDKNNISSSSHSLRKPRKLQQEPKKIDLAPSIERTITAYDAILDALPDGADPVDHYPYTMMKDHSDPFDNSDVAFFWHVPKSAGSSLKHILGTCLNKVIASGDGEFLCHQQVEGPWEEDEERLRICTNKFGRFLNLDMSTSVGIAKAKLLNLVPSGLADAIISVHFRSAIALFTPERKSRTVVLFRHPVDRIVSTFHYLAQATWEKTYKPNYTNMTILDYALGNDCPSDWVTRSLLGLLGSGYHRKLTDNDLLVAKELLRRKVLVLMMNDLGGAVQRLVSYFGWGVDSFTPDAEQCISDTLESKANHVGHAQIEKGSEAWNAIVEKNRYDMELFVYAHELYENQKKIFNFI